MTPEAVRARRDGSSGCIPYGRPAPSSRRAETCSRRTGMSSGTASGKRATRT